MRNQISVKRAVEKAVKGRNYPLDRADIYEEAALILEKKGLNPAAYPTVRMYLCEELDKLAI